MVISLIETFTGVNLLLSFDNEDIRKRNGIRTGPRFEFQLQSGFSWNTWVGAESRRFTVHLIGRQARGAPWNVSSKNLQLVSAWSLLLPFFPLFFYLGCSRYRDFSFRIFGSTGSTVCADAWEQTGSNCHSLRFKLIYARWIFVNVMDVTKYWAKGAGLFAIFVNSPLQWNNKQETVFG